VNTSADIGFEFSFAFQPLVDIRKREVVSYKALVRGPNGESSDSVLAQVPRHSFPTFDEICCRKAISLASRLKIPTKLNLNLSEARFYAVDRNISATFLAALQNKMPVENIIFEVTESENVIDQRNLLQCLQILRDFGFKTTIKGFGTGYSSLKLMMEYQPDYIKLDRDMIMNIHLDYVKQSLYSGIARICNRLSIEIVAEGIETLDEFRWLRDEGVRIFQGYYFARPTFEALPKVASHIFSM